MIQAQACNNEYELVIDRTKSESLNSELILEAVVLKSSDGLIEVETDDFVTFADQEATIEIKIESKKASKSSVLFVRIIFELSEQLIEAP